MSVIKKEFVSSAGSLQVCGGQETESEAATHATEKNFKEKLTEKVLLVDTTNAFNSINRKVFLHNISFACPARSTFATNCYATLAWLLAVGGKEKRSNEKIIQVDPVAMVVYALDITPFIMTS